MVIWQNEKLIKIPSTPLSKVDLIGLYRPLNGVTNPKYKLLHLLTTRKKCKEKKALAFNWDRCCRLVLCLQLILFVCDTTSMTLSIMLWWVSRLFIIMLAVVMPIVALLIVTWSVDMPGVVMSNVVASIACAIFVRMTQWGDFNLFSNMFFRVCTLFPGMSDKTC